MWKHQSTQFSYCLTLIGASRKCRTVHSKYQDAGGVEECETAKRNLLKVIEAMEGYAQSFAKGKRKLIV